MSASIRGKSIDKSTVQELGGLELSDLEKANSPTNRLNRGARLERPILRIPIEKIVGDSPMQTRLKTFEPGTYEEDRDLLKSIKKFGVLEPIMVSRESDSRGEQVYNLVFGHRRKAAAELVGHKSIPAIVAKPSDNIHLLTLAENTGTRSLTPYERSVGLIRWKENNPELTQTKLAEDTGISQGTVSTLMTAYEASTPALRGLFASGMAPRAVVELQEVFEHMSEDEQVKLAQDLDGATKREVQYIVELLNEGIDQTTAIETVGTSRKNEENHSKSVEALADEDQLRAVAELTGAPIRRVRTLARKATIEGAGMETLQLASLYIARGGSVRNPIFIAHKLSANGKINRLVTQSLRYERKARKFIEKTRDAREARFLRTLFLGETG
jgi:ParB/RepB/Spo0J family partition protein